MGESRVDHATMAFRLVLADASEQEQARVDALMALWQRTVFAATWPSPNEAPRTLTNSHGESALPIFSGVDTLEVGANRFSWREPDGSIRFREMPAREALRYAMARQVNFVVLDVGFEHAVEFALEEFEPLVAQREPTLPGASASDREAAVRDAVRRSNRPAAAPPPPSASAPQRMGSGPQVIQTRGAHASRHAEPPPARPHAAAPHAQASANQQQPPRAAGQPRSPAAHAPPAAGAAVGGPRSQSASGPQLKQSLAPPHAAASAGIPRPKMASGPQLKQTASSAPPQPLAASASASSRPANATRSQVASGPQLKQQPGSPLPQPSATAGWAQSNSLPPAAADMLRPAQPLSGPRLKSSIPAPLELPQPSAAESPAEQRPTSRPISGSELIAQPQASATSYSHQADSAEVHAANAAPLAKSDAAERDRRKAAADPSASAIETQRRLPVRTTPLPAAAEPPQLSSTPTLPSGSPLPPPPTPGPRRRTTPMQLSAAVEPAPPAPSSRQPTAAMFTQPPPQAPATSFKPPRQRPTTPLQLSISAEALFTPDALPPQDPSNQQFAQTPLSYPSTPAQPARRPTTPLELSAPVHPPPLADAPAAPKRSRTTTPLPLAAAVQAHVELDRQSTPEARAALPTARPPRSIPANQQPKPAAELRRTPPPVPEAAKSRAPSTPEPRAPVEEPVPQPKPPAMRRRRDDEPTLAERPNRINTQRGVQASVPDSTLEALSSELRSFPEVEWACVLFDETDVPLIGVRVDPSFLNRVADITDVILDTGERQSVTLQVLLLNNQEQVKNARRNGRAFYPWTQASQATQDS